MFIVLKGALLFLSIIVFMPIVFFVLVGGFGRSFALTIHPTSWLARTKVKWIRTFTKKFMF